MRINWLRRLAAGTLAAVFLLLLLPFAETADAANVTAASDGEIDTQIREMLDRMTTEQKLAQMMIVALRSDDSSRKYAKEIDENYAELLRQYDFGGILLFGGNIVDMEQTVTLIRDAQTAAKESDQGIPMLICVDQEGGSVNRVSFGTIASGNMALAATGDTALTEEIAGILGEEIRSMGFNMDFAPVSDVNNNPANPIIGVRSFSDNPELAARHVTAFLRGLSESGVSAALKHFPGHGNVGEDSHTGLPSSDLTVDELKACELIPFQAGIDAGANMIMTAHIQYPNIEKNTYVSKLDGEEVFLPATLSRTIMTDLLREEMGYDGIIITDSLVMKAIADHFDWADAGALAIQAGVDILLDPAGLYKDEEVDSFSRINNYMEALLAKVEAGEISQEEIDDSVARILKLKLETGLLSDTPSGTLEEQLSHAKAVVGSAEHHTREWEIAQKGMTLLKNEGGVLPLDGKDEILLLIPSEYRRATAEYALSRLEREGLLEDASAVTVLNYENLSIEDEELQSALATARTVLLLSQSTRKIPVVSDAISQIHQKEEGRAVLLSLSLPYDTAFYQDADAILCAYYHSGNAHDAEGNGPFNLNVAVAICTAFGQSVPQGRLPVNVPRVSVQADGSFTFLDSSVPLCQRGFGMENWGEKEPGTDPAPVQKKTGCYVATSVYGSYDCPEVWTLRRFRDEVLAETWYGRLFIKLYYAVSPTAVRLFGDTDWFREFWKGRLDHMTADLQAEGFASTPYQDRDW